MCSRKVEGPKEIGSHRVKVVQAQEIDYLLARQPETSASYQGANDRAFEASLLKEIPFSHAEEDLESFRTVGESASC